MDTEKIRHAKRKWKQANPDKRLAQKKRYFDKNRQEIGIKKRQRKSWTIEEVLVILSPDRPSDRELSKKLKRSMASIMQMRCKVRSGQIAWLKGLGLEHV